MEIFEMEGRDISVIKKYKSFRWFLLKTWKIDVTKSAKNGRDVCLAFLTMTSYIMSSTSFARITSEKP